MRDSNKLKNLGGPHNLGDPDDKSLRKIEVNVLIPQKMRDKAKEKCAKEVTEFEKCCKNNNLLMGFKCKKENTVLKSCLELWYTNAEFQEQCKQEYLQERSEYRRTGIPAKARLGRAVST